MATLQLYNIWSSYITNISILFRITKYYKDKKVLHDYMRPRWQFFVLEKIVNLNQNNYDNIIILY